VPLGLAELPELREALSGAGGEHGLVDPVHPGRVGIDRPRIEETVRADEGARSQALASPPAACARAS